MSVAFYPLFVVPFKERDPAVFVLFSNRLKVSFQESVRVVEVFLKRLTFFRAGGFLRKSRDTIEVHKVAKVDIKIPRLTRKIRLHGPYCFLVLERKVHVGEYDA